MPTKIFVLFLLCLPLASVSVRAEPQRFAPDAISLDDTVTLTPAITPDGKTAYFSRADCERVWLCPQRLHVSHYENGAWTAARRLERLGDYRVDWPTLSVDGSTLVFSWTKPRETYANLDIGEDFDLYTLDLANPDAMPVPIDGADVNRPRAGRLKTLRAFHVESVGTFTAAGDLYFWDEREDAIGERDVFVAMNDGAGGLRKAKPLPAPVNSPGRDQFNWINPDGNVMLLSYPDRGGSGADDIFIARRQGEVWSEPVNLGPLVNSAAVDGGARITPDGEQLLFTSTRAFGDTDEGLLQVWSITTAELLTAGVLRPSDLH
jgi:hypothetical protein